jgi:hypothetical protein
MVNSTDRMVPNHARLCRASSGPQDIIDSIDSTSPNGHNPDKSAGFGHRHILDNPSIVIDSDEPRDEAILVAVDTIDSYRSSIDTLSIVELAIDKPNSTALGQTIDGIDDRQEAESVL